MCVLRVGGCCLGWIGGVNFSAVGRRFEGEEV